MNTVYKCVKHKALEAFSFAVKTIHPFHHQLLFKLIFFLLIKFKALILNTNTGDLPLTPTGVRKIIVYEEELIPEYIDIFEEKIIPRINPQLITKVFVKLISTCTNFHQILSNCAENP